MAGFGTDFFPILFQTGGGGSSIPTITASVTLNVPATYPTINDALDFVRSAVVLDGALVTIAVDGAAYTMNEQVSLIGENMPFLTLTATAPVTVDTTGFIVNTPFGLPATFFMDRTTIGSINGTWSKAAGAPCLGMFLVNADAQFGNQPGAFALNAFDISIYSSGCRLLFANASVIDNGVFSINTFFNLSDIKLYTCTFNGVGLHNWLNSSIYGVGGTLGATGGGVLDAVGSTVNLENYASIAGGVALGGINLINCKESVINIDTNTLTFNVVSPVIVCNNSNVCISVDTFVNSGAANPNCVDMRNGRLSLAGSFWGGGVVSTGVAVNCFLGGIVQLSGPLANNFTGGYSQPVNVATANGLIIG